MKKVLFLLLYFSIPSIYAQQLPEISLRDFDYTIYNPAANGTKPFSEVMLHHRSQWIGFKNAPSTQFLTYNGKINESMGLGSYIINDITGPTRRLSASVAYNYKVKFENFKLSLGLAAGIMQYGIDGNKIDIYENNDNAVNEHISMKSIRPNVDFGAWLFTDKFYSGISIMQLLSNKIKLSSEDLNATIKLANHFYITSGYNIDLNEEIKLQPSFIVAGTFGTPLIIDLGAKAEFSEKFTFGLHFRTNDAIVILAGVKIKKIFTIAYSYDFIFSKFRQYNSGSHDIVLAFDILPKKESENTKKKRHKSHFLR